MEVLWTKPWSSNRETSAPSQEAVCPDPKQIIYISL